LELVRPASLEEATARLGEGNGALALGGGTELVPQLRDGILAADTLVDLRHALPQGIRDGRIGAGATLAELEGDPQVPDALREACRLAASPQLRNMGTIGGNLLQSTRCWYWRLQYPCRLHGGDRCFAREGEHREHAILGNGFCSSAHPSDPAAALLALGATLHTDRRTLPVADLYRLPTAGDARTTTLEPGELIVELELPETDASVYLKAMDRRRWSFPLVGVAAARVGGATRIALAGVAPVPWLLGAAEELDAATPLPGTAFKVEIARALVARAVAAVA
jgi:xanthine dehydrogenase YagS FAD-binding subunit